jgi:hypothetical protein
LSRKNTIGKGNKQTVNPELETNDRELEEDKTSISIQLSIIFLI